MVVPQHVSDGAKPLVGTASSLSELRSKTCRKVPSRDRSNWVGVVSGLFNPNDFGVGALERRPRHDEGYTKEAAVAAEALLLDDWFDAIEDGVRARARGFIETMLEEELSEALSRPRYGRRKPGEDEAAPSVVGVRHGHRERTLTGTFGKTRIAVPRARLTGEDGKTREWRSGSLRAYQRRTRAADALIAGLISQGPTPAACDAR